MARRRKHRTHVKSSQPTNIVPSSFIIKHGQVGSSLSQLVRDLRKVMEPNTATRLRERTRNKLKDYLTLAPALHVTHLLALTLTPIAPYLRMIRLSAGPTLTFRIERYSLSRDIVSTKKHARSMGLEYLTPPLLVLASFPQPSPTTKHLSLLMKSFQSLFPPLAPQTLSLSSARRVVLVQYNPEHDTVDVRHYLITVKPYGVSRRIRKIIEGATSKSQAKSRASSKSSTLLDLGREQDVADFVLRRRGEPGPDGDGYESAASSASSAVGDDDADAVSLTSDYVGRNNKKGSKRAIRLDEIGPRMELRLVKITEGVPGKDGAVLYHSFVKKSKAETAAQKRTHAEKEKLRQQRREEQERNVERKKATENKKGVKFADEGDEDQEEDEDEIGDGEGNEEDVGEWDDEEEVTEGEESEGDQSEDESEEEEPVERPKKKGKHRKYR